MISSTYRTPHDLHRVPHNLRPSLIYLSYNRSDVCLSSLPDQSRYRINLLPSFTPAFLYSHQFSLSPVFTRLAILLHHTSHYFFTIKLLYRILSLVPSPFKIARAHDLPKHCIIINCRTHVICLHLPPYPRSRTVIYRTIS